jgi:hypothetical protein
MGKLPQGGPLCSTANRSDVRPGRGQKATTSVVTKVGIIDSDGLKWKLAERSSHVRRNDYWRHAIFAVRYFSHRNNGQVLIFLT